MPVLRELGLLELCKKFLSFAKVGSPSRMKVDPCTADVSFWMVPLSRLADESSRFPRYLPWIDGYFPDFIHLLNGESVVQSYPILGSVLQQEICYREEAPQHAYNSWGASEPEHCDVKKKDKKNVFPSSVAVFFSLGNDSDTGKSSLIL